MRSRLLLLVALSALLVGLLLLLGPSGVGWALGGVVAVAAAVGWLIAYSSLAVRRTRFVHRAMRQLGAGDLEAARATLDELEASHPGWRTHGVAQLRAVVTMRRGDFDGALARLEADLAALPASDEAEPLASRAIRALLLLTAGRDEEARADADAVLARRDEVHANALGRAILVRGALAARAEDQTALAEVMRKGRWLMLTTLTGRERALGEALATLAAEGQASPYRRTPGPESDLSLARWVGAFVPAATAFVRPTPPRDVEAAAVALAEPSMVAREAVARAHDGRVSTAREKVHVVALAVGVVACGVFAAAKAPQDYGVLAATVTIVAGLGLVLGVRFWRGRQAWTRMNRAVLRIQLGELDRARAAIEPELEASDGTQAGAAHLYLAAVESAHGDNERALELCDRGMALLRGASANALTAGAADDRTFSGLLHDNGLQLRAGLLASLGRFGEAAAQLEKLDDDMAETARIHVALLAAAREGDVHRVMALTTERPIDVALPPQQLVLGELARICAGEATDAARELFRGELEERPDLRRWLERVTPEMWAMYDERDGAVT